MDSPLLPPPHTLVMRSRILIVALAALSMVASCGDSVTGSSAVAGTYNLRTINGAVLPYVQQVNETKVELLSDQIVVSANGTFTSMSTFRSTTGTVVALSNGTDSGTYSVSGASIILKYKSDGSTSTGVIAGNDITLQEQGFVFVYSR